MRTISVRLDDLTDAALAEYCRRRGLTQTDAVKSAIEQLAGQHRASPAELAAELGLIGGFGSTEGDLATSHALRIRERLSAKRARESLPLPQAKAKTATTRAKPKARRVVAA